MEDKSECIDEILQRELKMFTSVNARGPAPCRSNPEGFILHRRAQFSVWSSETLTSYLNDLKTAENEDKNLMTLKYARMEGIIDPLNENPLIDEIVAMEYEWQKEALTRYPAVLGGARPLSSGDDSAWATSFETYLRGELETYSDETLRLLHNDLLQMKGKEANYSLEVYDYLMRSMGYESLDEAEERIRNKNA